MCDLTDNDTNTAYDRHGDGVCNAACAGDSSMACGGDMAFSLYQTGSCGECPNLLSIEGLLDVRVICYAYKAIKITYSL